MAKEDKLKSEIINALQEINEMVCYYQDDKGVRNSVCRNLRKIHSRVDKLTNKSK